MGSHHESGRSGWAREQLDLLRRRARGGSKSWQEHLTDPDGAAMAETSPALTCRVFVSREDADDHAQMHNADHSDDERLNVALGSLGRRDPDGELAHVDCVLAVVDSVIDGLGPEETRLAERTATVASAACRSTSVKVPLADPRVWRLGLRLAGAARAAWLDRLEFLSTSPARFDWDGRRERAEQQRHEEMVAQHYEEQEAGRERRLRDQALEDELAERVRRGEYPALWKDRPRQTVRPAPKRRPPGF